MIPVSLYGIDVDMCERFYSELPSLVADSIDDEHYAKTIYSIQEKASIEHVFISEKWSKRPPQVWPEDIMMEMEMILVVDLEVGILETEMIFFFAINLILENIGSSLTSNLGCRP